MANLKHHQQVPRAADHIDRNLKKAFDELAAEPLPERFTDLLEQLRKAELPKKDIQ
ncbi:MULTISPECIES: NepR family anti-sigma factor [unclassified Leisingera]|uniref:NepR family anti-sigma factor n=1 Tax=unclassified Leisingera TaxID=2614906 RepID=UPI001011C152|nr:MULTISPECIES: NepR family anti-sigma factor [unclassified Leisingera]MCF6432691.1 RNA polymerase subunit sigma-70 [Leisingera sp. MMG026]QAX28113.1 RNA polymerase subunit sigma-70 [Leisingera sp. NJS204]